MPVKHLAIDVWPELDENCSEGAFSSHRKSPVGGRIVEVCKAGGGVVQKIIPEIRIIRGSELLYSPPFLRRGGRA